MGILIPASTLAAAKTPLEIGSVVYSRDADGQYGYAVVVAHENANMATRFLLRTLDGVPALSLSTSAMGCVMAGNVEQLFFRLRNTIDSYQLPEERVGLLGVDVSGAVVHAQDGHSKNAVMVEAKDWRVSTNAQANLWSSMWQLIHVDLHGKETIVLDAKPA